jgi:hypothetical protein
VERLSANQTGVVSDEFKWSQVLEAALDLKTWLWIVLAMLPNMGSALTSFSGLLIINGFGFDKFQASLLNIPFGAMQTIVIILSCWTAQKMKLKGLILVAFMIPVVVGNAMLYGLNRGPSNRPALLTAYYLLAFLFAGNPLLLSWVLGNTAGATKKSVTLALYQAGLSAGDLIGPLLFNADQAPEYHPAIAGVLGVFIAMIVFVLLQLALLVFLNRRQAKKRVRNGKSAAINNQSMATKIATGGKVQDQLLAELAVQDMTNRENDEFVYVY